MAYIGPEPNPGQNREVDDISSSFNGSTTAFTLQVNSQNASPGSANAIIVSLGGVLQNPGTDYTVAASTLTFTTAPASGLSFFGLLLGQGVDTQETSDVSITPAKIATGLDFTFNSVSVGKGANSVAGNTVLGESALDASVTGGNNTAVGKQALTENTTGTSNVAVGANALDANTTGANNTACGQDSLSANTTADANTAVGTNALLVNTTGGNNTSVGKDSLRANTTGGNNTAVGESALKANTTATKGTAVGQNCLQANTTGAENTAVGTNALLNNSTGNQNTALGVSALQGNSTAGNNTALGFEALKGNTTGSINTAAGKDALKANTTGYENTALGQGALDSTTTGYRNIGVGNNAGDVITTGNNNLIIGRNADPSANNAVDQIVVGNALTGKGTSTGFYGGSAGVFNSDNTSAWQTTSDRRIKKNIVDNNIGLDKINQIRVRNFEYRTPEEVDPSLPSHAAIDSEGIKVGVIAQEIQEILPDVVKQMSTGCYSVNPDNITWYLVKAIQELSAKVTALEAG